MAAVAEALAEGPAERWGAPTRPMRLVQAEGFSIEGLTLATRDLAHARHALAAAGLLQAQDGGRPMLSLAATGGLRIDFV